MEPPPQIVRMLQEARPEFDFSDDCFFRTEDELVKCLVNRELAPINERLADVLYDCTESHSYTEKLKTPIEANRQRYRQGFSAAIGRAEIAAWVREYLDGERSIIRNWYEELAIQRLGLQAVAEQQQACCCGRICSYSYCAGIFSCMVRTRRRSPRHCG